MKKIIIFCLFFMQLFICIATAQPSNNTTSKIYLGQSLEEIQQTVQMQMHEFDTESNTVEYIAFVNPMAQYNIDTKNPAILKFYNNKLCSIFMVSELNIPENSTKNYEQWCILITKKLGRPIIVSKKDAITAWLNGNQVISVKYLDFSNLSKAQKLDTRTAVAISVDFLDKDNEPIFK